MTSVDLLGPEPVYRQIAAIVAQRIKDGDYPPRRAIPSEAEMCEEFGVSRNTVRAAVKVLNEEGYAKTVPGKGTFALAQGGQSADD